MAKNNKRTPHTLPGHGGQRGKFGLEVGLAVLVLLTLMAIVAERPILETSLTLTADDGYVASYDDSGEGGRSSSIITDPHAMQWRCELADQGPYTFCGFELILDLERQSGIDLRRYDRIRIDLNYEGPTETIRFYLRNFDTAYSIPQVNDSTKYNQIEFNAALASGGDPLEFAMADFFVANWWFQRYRLSPAMGHPQFDNIVVIEVQTGSTAIPGEHRFELGNITFTGQILTTEQWYQFIVGVWLAAALIFLGSRTLVLKGEIRRRRWRERELMEINRLLDSRGRALEEKARTDPLTGAFNREGIEGAIKVGLEEYRRQGKPLSLILLDVDHFKQVNDRFGHGVGDQILTGLTRLVQANIRDSDIFARWGGEEFLLVCRNTSLYDAANLAEKLRQLIASHDFGEPGRVTASFGVATLRSQESLDQIFSRTDEALYKAKGAGRDRAEVSR
ncbi:GGDEF domain-containing protein [Marinimicrobium alkaliphilum]|uniref:GGDEF domain-containing protein n=1 Tax=Marinimicrobium alkaliphilum TaxID=2202654 RepID=UPI000DB94D42|nr:GGDEF domain-containing protein [Marinimicrobium alkaliphilum]